jgi:arsenate reductase
MLKVLFLCTENACRSQMAEGLANHYLAGKVKAFSAGVAPTRLNPRAVQVMAELGINISGQRAKSVADLPGEQFDLVVTVCDAARAKQDHLSFADPARATGTAAEILSAFRRVRDEMRERLIPFLQQQLVKKEN